VLQAAASSVQAFEAGEVVEARFQASKEAVVLHGSGSGWSRSPAGCGGASKLLSC
jgi:hypothetical protein